jgi:hypothetical protein
MSKLPGQKDGNGDLRELGNPEFFAYWAAVRNRLVQTSKSKPEHFEIKRIYGVVITEYRRRIDGGMALTTADN